MSNRCLLANLELRDVLHTALLGDDLCDALAAGQSECTNTMSAGMQMNAPNTSQLLLLTQVPRPTQHTNPY